MHTCLYFVLVIQVTLQTDCIWKDNAGYEYDLSVLDKKGGWQQQDDQSGMGMFSMIYVFNFCDFSPIKCHDRSVGIYEGLAVMGQVTENCDVVGSAETREVQHLDKNDPKKGIQISYSLGDLCLDTSSGVKKGGQMSPRSANFQIECSSYDESKFTVLPGNECIDNFKIKHSGGCRPSLFTIFGLMNWILIGFGLYMIGMFIYNRKHKGLEGNEAIPHLEVWQQIGPLLRQGIEQLRNKINQIASKFQGESGYNTV